MPLTRIPNPRRRLSDEVYDQLMGAIYSGDIGPKDTLVQEVLASELEISRTPVREALLRLEQEGVLIASKRGSFRLCRLDKGEVRELYQARTAIEGQAARILAAIMTRAQAEELRNLVEAEESAGTTAMAHRAIHRGFVSRAGNRYLLEMFDMVWNKGMAFGLFADPGQAGSHRRLVDILETGDRSAALAAFSQHVQDGFDRHMDGLAD